MKKKQITFNILLIFLSSKMIFPQSQVVKKFPSSNARINSIIDFRKHLVGTTWSWQRANCPPEKLQFFPNGTAHHTSFAAEYVIKSPNEVELQLGKDKANLMFNDTCTRYVGFDFDGQRPIAGERQCEPRALSEDEFQKLLTETNWSWRRANHSLEKLQFFPNGTAQHTSFTAKYVIKSPNSLELLLGKDIAKLIFNDTYSRYEGIDFDGQRPITGERQCEPVK